MRGPCVLVFESMTLVNVKIEKIVAKYLGHNPTTTRRALEGRLAYNMYPEVASRLLQGSPEEVASRKGTLDNPIR